LMAAQISLMEKTTAEIHIDTVFIVEQGNCKAIRVIAFSICAIQYSRARAVLVYWRCPCAGLAWWPRVCLAWGGTKTRNDYF